MTATISAAERERILRAVVGILGDVYTRSGFTGQVTIELNYADGAAKTAYVNTREGVRFDR